MYFTRILGSILLAATALASPLSSRNVALSKRADSDGQAGAYITAGEDVSFAFVYGSKTCPNTSFIKHYPYPLYLHYRYIT